ncbi:MAG: hypothetical protein M3Z29_06890 [Pseudomonadota bacterium]|nr:hypothetical protein [Pseudomonadota bacterium]
MSSHAFRHAVVGSTSPGFWETSAGAPSAETSPGDLSALGDHVSHCNGSRGRWFALRCAADSVAGFIAPRFVTILVIVLIVFGVASLVA